ncbi:serine/threonine protein kinase, partial [bacterium]|nr:serine/threonine protein kinase [bacterium]
MAERDDGSRGLDRLADLVGELNDITGDDSLAGGLDAADTRIARNLAILGRIGAFRPDDDGEDDEGDGAPQPAATADVPEAIGPYRLRERIGSGGMGDVYLAEQTAPLQRTVALKIIKPGMDSREIIRRFERERQALAAMDHPHIAKVFDAGMAANGRPYFVMEYVAGEPITAWCDRRRLGNAARLELFRQVCAGVQHAHQKGIIHRDLKPSNVLVTEVDGRPQPRIIDFGVARAVERDADTGATLFTEDGRLVGTPEYMSPEQASLGGGAVDTRTDVYSLGVLLYELIVGRLPFEPETLRLAGVAEIQRILREVDPPRPSARLATLAGEADIGDNRATPAAALRRQVSGDLDWIVMKALAKEPQRRYDTAAAFADDIGRHLAHEPVQAGPPGLGYRAGKFVRRHRGGVTAAALVAAALLAGLAGTTWQSVQATRARDEARRQAEIARAVNAFFIDTFGHRDPLQTGGETGLSVAEAMDRAAARIPAAYADDPALELELRRVVGRSYMRLGAWAQAQEHLDRAWALTAAAPAVPRLGLMRELGELARDRGDLALAARWFAAVDSALADQPRPDVAERIENLHLRGTVARLAGDLAAADSLLALAAAVRDSLPAAERDPNLGLDSDRADLLVARGETAAADSAFAAFAARVTAVHGP